jgi:hypothetical protein
MPNLSSPLETAALKFDTRAASPPRPDKSSSNTYRHEHCMTCPKLRVSGTASWVVVRSDDESVLSRNQCSCERVSRYSVLGQLASTHGGGSTECGNACFALLCFALLCFPFLTSSCACKQEVVVRKLWYVGGGEVANQWGCT